MNLVVFSDINHHQYIVPVKSIKYLRTLHMRDEENEPIYQCVLIKDTLEINGNTYLELYKKMEEE